MFTARNAKLFSFQRATGQRKLAAHHRIRLSRDRRNWGLSELHIGSIDCLHRLHRKVDHNWHAIHIVERFLPMYGKFKGISLLTLFPTKINRNLQVAQVHSELPWAAGPSLVCHIGRRNPWATTDVVSRLQDPRAPETDHDGPRTRRHLMSINVCYGIQWEFHVGLMGFNGDLMRILWDSMEIIIHFLVV
jgi:hypothetical protein